MKPFTITTICLFLCISNMLSGEALKDSIPSFYDQPLHLNSQQLILRASEAFVSSPIPSSDDWEKERAVIKAEIIRKTGAIPHQDLALDVQVLKTIQRSSYRIENIIFQTRPGVYATANLFIPNGTGPFPGVITMM